MARSINLFIEVGSVARLPSLSPTRTGFAVAELIIIGKTEKWDKNTSAYAEKKQPIKLKLTGNIATQAVTHLKEGTEIIAKGHVEGYLGESRTGEEYISNNLVVDELDIIGGQTIVANERTMPEEDAGIEYVIDGEVEEKENVELGIDEDPNISPDDIPF